jgi:hypothetical protein
MVEVGIDEPEDSRRMYVRRPWRLGAEAVLDDIEPADAAHVVGAEPEHTDGVPSARFEVVARERRPDGSRLVTVILANRAASVATTADTTALFQVGFSVTTFDADGDEVAGVLPYPGPPVGELDAEERSLALLHRRSRTFAIGHGCSAEWSQDSDVGRVRGVAAVALPVAETPSITPDITDADGSPLHIPMATLAGLVPGDDGMRSLERLLDAYGTWIVTLRDQVDDVEEGLRDTARTHVMACETALERMRRGVGLLRSDTKVRRAFELANRAILAQQLRTEPTPRRAIETSEREGVRFERDALVVEIGRAHV